MKNKILTALFALCMGSTAFADQSGTSPSSLVCIVANKIVAAGNLICPVEGGTDIFICQAPANDESQSTLGLFIACRFGCSTQTNSCYDAEVPSND